MSCVSEDEDRGSSDNWGSVDREDEDEDEEGDDGEILKTFLELQGRLDDDEGGELSPASSSPSSSAASPGQVLSFSFMLPAASSWPAGLGFARGVSWLGMLEAGDWLLSCE